MHPGILVAAGALLGSVGLKALTSKPAKKAAVKGIVCGMQAKESVETIVDQARAQFDDLMAEASYEHKSEKAQEAAEEVLEAVTSEASEEK